jgi:hypothetical protein
MVSVGGAAGHRFPHVYHLCAVRLTFRRKVGWSRSPANRAGVLRLGTIKISRHDEAMHRLFAHESSRTLATIW